MLKGIFETPKTLQLAVARVDFQRDVSTTIPAKCRPSSSIAHVTKRFDEWREIWRNDEGDQDIKFETFAKTDHIIARKVHRQLALMAQALFDAHALDEHFGMKPQRWPDRVGLSPSPGTN
jgi:hypothetical protein